LIVGGFTITKMVSETGAHGMVVACTDDTKARYAMKIELQPHEMDMDNLAMTEITNHPSNRLCKDLHVPRLYRGFKEAGKEIAVMDLLGPNLDELKCSVSGNPSRKTIIQVGISLLHSLEEIHRSGWLHLSTKPHNLCMGGTEATRHKMYIVDFGRAEKYLTDEGLHRPPKKESGRYNVGYGLCSIWCKEIFTASRRDDIMNLGFVLMSLDGRCKPWIRAGVSRKQWLDGLSEPNGSQKLPGEKLVMEAYKLEYHEQPPYEELRQYLKTYAVQSGIVLDGKYDWDNLLCEEDGRIGFPGGYDYDGF
jgi:serine/threonine protein kinase